MPTRPRRARRATRSISFLLVFIIASARVGWSRDGGDHGQGASHVTGDASANRDFQIVGYLPEYRVGGVDWNATCAGVTHVLFFSLEPTSDGALGALDRFPDSETLESARLACDAHDTKLMVSVGGAGRSRFFPSVAASGASRRKFAKTVAAFCERHDLHGVDFNWEYPADAKQWDDLFELARAVKRAFKTTKDAKNKSKALFLAYHPDEISESFLNHPLNKHVDLMHAMAYDNAVDENGHRTLAVAKAVVSHAETNGLDKKKVSLGIPFYARGDKKTRRFKDVKTYADLAGVVAHLPVDAVFNGYTIDSVSSVTAKTRWALEAGAGGITIWELGQDLSFLDENSLLRAVAGAVWPDGRPKPPSRQKPSFASGEF